MMRELKMSKRDLNILLVFLGIVLLIMSYFFICRHYRALENATRAETEYLTPSLALLQEHEQKLAAYKQEIETSKETIAKLRKLHPEVVLPEEFVQLAVTLEAQTDTDVRSITTHETEPLSSYILPDADGNPALYSAYRQSFTFTAALGYGALKDMIEKIYSENERITLDSCSVAYNAEDGLLSATITVSQIFINDGSYTYQPVIVPSGQIGTTNPFNTLK
jgi:hypothetical protein